MSAKLPIVLEVSGGIVSARINPRNHHIIVMDYDVVGVPDSELKTDADGTKYIEYRADD